MTMIHFVENEVSGGRIRYYRLGEEVNLVENKSTEFKQHRVFTNEYILNEQKGQLKPYSPTLNAFINTKGGTLYCGISDKGIVKGIHMTNNQKLHFSMAVLDLVERYSPPVNKADMSITYVPVLYRDETGYRHDLSFPSVQDIRRPHKLRSPQQCWCDLEAKSLKEQCLVPPLYVVEIQVVQAIDFVATEAGQYFLRGQGSNLKHDLKQLQELRR